MSRMVLSILCFVINEPPVNKNGQGDEYLLKLQLLVLASPIVNKIVWEEYIIYGIMCNILCRL